MKVNELMYGDFVISTQNKKVYQIDSNLTYSIAKAILDGESDIDSRFEPISLTDEILRKNGFVYKEDYRCYVLSKDCTVSLKVNILGEGELRFNIFSYLKEVKYVHELQHALRLCGLNKLANNFKIK